MRKWLRQAQLLARESTMRNQHGCVFVKGDERVCGGFNLVPSQLTDEYDLTATSVAMALALRTGLSLAGTWLYTTEPVSTLVEAKMLILSGVKHIIRHSLNPMSAVDAILDEAGIGTEYYDKPIGEFTCSRL